MLFTRFPQLAALILATLLAGCAGGPTVRMSEADKANIKAVTMQAPPAIPADMFFHGRAQSFLSVGGLLGAAMAESVPKEPKEQLLETMKANGIDLSLIIKNEFFAASASRGLLTQADPGSMAQGDLSLTVNVYGFGQTQGFSSLLFPLLNVTATIKKPNGEIAWQKTEFAAPLNSENKYGYEFEQYIREPELLRKTLSNISGIVSRMLVDALAADR
ncbi:hypothetical protein WAE56_04935 [Iodobacter sp. LRB]|uniref:hypothetical protein n=1 Tax=unclassified Iodobacter TaxID=235634 RepID=UPI000C0C74C5|nr:hypothetical protein [Iodobacter sp. BJB302]PHV02383.1 hypothetical protein CSQ88_06925 [Iodobacter sp. BJB302]